MPSKSMQATIFGVDQASPVFKKVAGSADDMADDAEKSGGRMGQAFSKAAKLAAGALAAVGFAEFAKDTIREASNMEQNIGAMQAVFKGTSREIEAFGATSAETVGIAKQDYYQLAAVFGSQLKNMGVASDQLAPKTNQLVTLGADLAAVYGGTAADAVDAISSLLRGERDPIERYGVSIKQASINAYELSHHLDTSTASAKTNADMQATLALLFEQTTDAQGQFAAQTDTLAESQQIATAKFKEAQAEIGAKLLPIVTDFTTFAANHLVPVLGFVADGIGGIISAVDAMPGPVKAGLLALVGFKVFQQAGVLGKIQGAFQGLREEMALQRGLAGMAGQELSGLGAGAAVARSKLGALAKSVGPGAALFLGITAITAVIEDARNEMNLTDKAIEAHKTAVESLADAYKQSGGVITKSVREQAWNDISKNSPDVVKWAKSQGIALSDLVDAYLGVGSAGGKATRTLVEGFAAVKDSQGGNWFTRTFGASTSSMRDFQHGAELSAAAAQQFLKTSDDTAESMKDEREAVDGSTAAKTKNTKSVAEQTLAYGSALRALNDYGRDAAKQRKATTDQTLAYNDARRALNNYGQIAAVEAAQQAPQHAVWQKTSDKVLGTAKAMKEANDKAHDLTSGSDQLEAALARLSGREPTVEEATRAFNGALQDAIESSKDAKGHVQQLGSGVVRASGEINTGTKAGQRLYDSVTSMAKGAQDAAIAQAELAGKTRGTKAAEDAAAKSLAHSRKQFIDNARQMGLTAEQAKKLADRYFGIPKDIRTVIKGVADFKDVDNRLQNLANNTVWVNIRGQYVGTTGGPRSRSFGTAMGFSAEGGAVVGGPKGVDTHPYMLAGGEHVLTAGDVDAMGGQEGVYAFRRALHSGLRRMASGGAVGAASPSVASWGGPAQISIRVEVPGGFVGSPRQLADELAPALADAVDRGKRKGTIRVGAFSG